MCAETTERRRGRPPSIDRTALLEAATRAFWRLGYDGASLGELTAATGVSRPTLYASFGDKAELFEAVLDHYGATTGAAPLLAFEAAPDIAAAVAAFLRVAAEGNTRPDAPSGCLIACCAATAAERAPALRDRLHRQAAAATDRLARRFAAEVEAGHLDADPSPGRRATLLLDLMYAQAVRARSGATRADLLADLDARVHAVLGGTA
ncbi:MAG: TetR/AcrR family transcriptional regulator [Pseudomonadota bacterium]